MDAHANAHRRRYADDRDEDVLDEDDLDDGEARARRPRRGLVSRLFGLVKLTLVLTPLTLLGYGYFVADCRSGGGGGGTLGGLLQAGICARGEIVGGAVSLRDNLGLIRRVIE